MKKIEKILKAELGSTYGGPSISYENNEFILYVWGDAPVSSDVLARGKTLLELTENIEKLAKKKHK